MNENRKNEYAEFINSEEWKAIRDTFVKDKRCAMCGVNREIEAHHIRYQKGIKGYCDMSNLVPLCRTCHNNVHFLESEISAGWSKRDDVSMGQLTYRLNIFRYRYEHGTVHNNFSTLDYMKRLISFVPEDKKNTKTRIMIVVDGVSDYKEVTFGCALQWALKELTTMPQWRGWSNGKVE